MLIIEIGDRRITILKSGKSMLKIILVLLLSLASTSAIAEWLKVSAIHSQDSPEIQIAYTDPATIHKDGNLVTMMVLVDHQSGLSKEAERRLDSLFSGFKKDIIKSWKVQDEFDCKADRLRMLSYTAYTEHMGNGEIVPSNVVTGEWEPVLPGSIGEALWKFACGKR
ncbi:MAG: hypothetical protein LJE57_11325 [Gallionella sp.]|nr:hypothetical protein [Gallionella sp.]